MRSSLIVTALLVPIVAHANGRAPITNGVFFKPGDTNAVYVATTFGFFVSQDGCHFYWLCENNIGYGGTFDPVYAVTPSGAILATTFKGLSVSRDGGCSFAFATAQLPASDPGNISMKYLTAVDVGPTGEVWVGSSDTPADNSLFHSSDDAMTFAPSAMLPNNMWYQSIKVAPGDAKRIYTSTYQIGGVATDGGQTRPTGHFFRSDDDGATWTEELLTGVIPGSVPQFYVMAVSPLDENVVFMASEGANPPAGDRLYRSSDGGVTFAQVLTTIDLIRAVVVRDAQTVLVATQMGGSFLSTDGGMTFVPIANAPQLACLAQRSDGLLFGCAADGSPDYMALGSSADGQTWQRVFEFEYMTGPLSCPAGTVQHTTCEQTLWRGLSIQFGVQPSTCAAGPPGGGGVDPPLVDGTTHKRGGCCEADRSPSSILLAAVVGLWLRRRRSGGDQRAACHRS